LVGGVSSASRQLIGPRPWRAWAAARGPVFRWHPRGSLRTAPGRRRAGPVPTAAPGPLACLTAKPPPPSPWRQNASRAASGAAATSGPAVLPGRPLSAAGRRPASARGPSRGIPHLLRVCRVGGPAAPEARVFTRPSPTALAPAARGVADYHRRSAEFCSLLLDDDSRERWWCAPREIWRRSRSDCSPPTRAQGLFLR